MKLLKPKKLESGDVIGIISPSSSPENLEKIENGVNYLEKLGYKVEIGENVGKVHGYLAGTDEERLSDLHSMFKNKNVKAIFSIRGGYGSGRLLNRIDYSLIKKNPKIFVGYSDITLLQMAIYKKTGLVTFAGPMVATDFSGDINEFAEDNFWRIISSTKKIGKLHNPRDEKFYALNSGRGEGPILGGNLAVLGSLMGTEYLPNLKNSILLLEDIGETPYRIDRLLNQLKLAKVFDSVKGIILGRFVDCYEKDKSKETIKLNEVIEHYFSGLKIPVLYSFSHGHIKENLTIPLGLNCKLNTSRGFVEILENAVV
ncbi:MAG: LD-carboxypeptidase [Melioribacteraceae bacterium]|nr:LD-carboxypeptidase [Melioribacteraceae bacterium]